MKSPNWQICQSLTVGCSGGHWTEWVTVTPTSFCPLTTKPRVTLPVGFFSLSWYQYCREADGDKPWITLLCLSLALAPLTVCHHAFCPTSPIGASHYWQGERIKVDKHSFQSSRCFYLWHASPSGSYTDSACVKSIKPVFLRYEKWVRADSVQEDNDPKVGLSNIF